MTLVIENLVKKFPKEDTELIAIDNFNLVVNDEEFVCILGPSAAEDDNPAYHSWTGNEELRSV